MHHTVGKLAALAVVVGIGATVVFHAQQNMPNDELAAQQAAADTDADGKPRDPGLAGDPESPPEQQEPEFAAADDLDVVPAADKMQPKLQPKIQTKAQPTPLRDKQIVNTGGAAKLSPAAAAADEDGFSLSTSSDDPSGDPFAATGDADLPAQPVRTQPVRTQPRATAEAARPKIDILDVDEDPPVTEPVAAAPAKTAPAKTVIAKDATPSSKQPVASARGAVLSLDEPDSDKLDPTASKPVARSQPASGPRLLGATDDDSAKTIPAAKKKDDDLFPEDEPAPVQEARPAPVALDNDLDLTDDSEPSTPPRKLADDAKIGPPKRVIPKATIDIEDDFSIDTAPPRRTVPADEIPARISPEKIADEERTELGIDLPRQPMADDKRPSTPQPVVEDRRPAELGRTIEIDDTIPTAPLRKAPLPQITIEKQAPGTAVLGRPMVYYIHVRNVGTTTAQQVVVEDVIPAEMQVDGSIPQALLKDDRLIWKLGTLAAGQEKKIAVRVIPQSEGTIGGVATVSFAGESARPKVPVPQLKFDVSAPRQAALGTPVEFNFHVQNIGTVTANSVTIRNVLPAGLKHPDGDDLEYNLGELPAGKSQDIKLTLTAALAGPTINRVVVTADGDVAEEAQVQLDVVGPSLLVSRNGPKRMIPDKTASFSNTVVNPGTGQVTGVTVIEKIPPGMEFVNAGDGGIYDQAKRSVAWTFKQLNAGESRSVTISLRTVARGAQISVIRAYDSSGSTGEATATTKVAGAPALTIEFGDLPALVEPGEIVKVSMRILNRGSDTASAVRATITVPAELKILSADGPTSYREKVAGQPNAGASSATELQFAPIDKIEPKGDAIFELSLKAGPSGSLHIDVQAVCDQLPDPIRREEVINVVDQ